MIQLGLDLKLNYHGGGAGYKEPIVQIRYTTSSDALESAGIIAKDGTASLIKIEDGVYDIISYDALTFVSLFSLEQSAPVYTYYTYNYLYYTELNSLLDINKIEVLHGATLTETSIYVDDYNDVVDDYAYFSTFSSMDSMTEFIWSDTTPSNLVGVNGMFYKSSGLVSADFSNFTENVPGSIVTSASMLYECTNLQTIDLSPLDFRNCIENYAMAKSCTNLTNITLPQNIGLTAGTRFAKVFEGCTSLINCDLSDIIFSGVDDIGELFNGNTSLECVSNIDTTYAGNKNTGIFAGCTSLIQPDAAAVALIEGVGGYNWTHPTSCP